jgi:hypothetical protein
MRIRLVPLLMSFVAASAAVVAAVALGTAIFPAFKRFALGISPAMIGTWVAIVVGVGTALMLATRRSASEGREDPSGGPRAGGPNKSLERRRDR